jgi:hypothetical protein
MLAVIEYDNVIVSRFLISLGGTFGKELQLFMHMAFNSWNMAISKTYYHTPKAHA